MAPTPPDRTAEQRQDALEQALRAREERAALKRRITDTSRPGNRNSAPLTVSEVLDVGHRGTGDRIVGRMEIGELLLAVDDIGPVKAAAILEAAGVEDAGEHLDELNAEQVAAIKAAVGD